MEMHRSPKMITRRLTLAVASVALVAMIIPGTVNQASAEDSMAQVAIVHASPEAPNVDIFVNGEAAFTDIAFGASVQAELPAGDYDVAVVPAGGMIEEAVLSATITVETGMTYVFAATGMVADLALRAFPISTTDLADGSARVVIVHASPDAPAVNVALTGGDVLTGNLAFGAADDAFDVPATSYDREVRVAGTMDVALPLPGVALDATTVYAVLAFGSLAAGDLTVLPIAFGAHAAGVDCATVLDIESDGDAACVMVLHLSPDAPAVDLYLDGSLAIEGLAFPDNTGFLAIPAGAHLVEIRANGAAAEDAPVLSAEVDLEAGVAYAFAAEGLLAEIMIVGGELDLSPLEAGMARNAVNHASPDSPAVDIAIAGGDVLIPNIEFGASSGYIEVPEGTYDLEVRVAGTMDVALSLPGVELVAGNIYDVNAIGLLADGSLTVQVLSAEAGIVGEMDDMGGDAATPVAAVVAKNI